LTRGSESIETASLRWPLVFDAPGMDLAFAIVHASLTRLATEALALLHSR
jgi:hypothetical protein